MDRHGEPALVGYRQRLPPLHLVVVMVVVVEEQEVSGEEEVVEVAGGEEEEEEVEERSLPLLRHPWYEAEAEVEEYEEERLQRRRRVAWDCAVVAVSPSFEFRTQDSIS
jgi:hypothetical protein